MNRPMHKVFIARADDINSNKRLYPLNEMQTAVEEYNTRTANFLTVDNMKDTVDLSKIVGVVLKLYMEGNDLYADIQPTETPMKRAVWNENGLVPGIHVRFFGFGNVNSKDDYAIVSDFRINHLNAHQPGVSVAWEEIG